MSILHMPKFYATVVRDGLYGSVAVYGPFLSQTRANKVANKLRARSGVYTNVEVVPMREAVG